MTLQPPSSPRPAADREDKVVIAGGSGRTLDLLRLATIRSDHVVLVALSPDPAARRYAERFAVEVRDRSPEPMDLQGAAAMLIAIGDIEAENRLVRAARRRGIPVHVADRELVSDFRLLEFLEQRPWAALAA